MKYSINLLGNYMCKDPPCIIIHSPFYQGSKIIFNTPSHIMRGVDANSIILDGNQTIMFTKHSTDTLNGFTYLTINYSDDTLKLRNLFPSFKVYGNLQTFFYLQTAKYHLGAKSLSLSYATWTQNKSYKIGVKDPALLKKIVKSKQFPLYVGKINKKIGNEDSTKILDARKYLNQHLNIYTDNDFQIKPIFQNSPRIKKQQKQDIQENATNFLCFFKKQTFVNNHQKSKVYCSGTLIITYRNLEQLRKILEKKDFISQIKQKNMLNELEETYLIKSVDEKNGQFNEYQGIIKQVVHIVEDAKLIQTSEFHLLFNKITQILKNKKVKAVGTNSQQIKITHLFYGYGLRTKNTSYQLLSEMYLKSNVFYTIMGKCFKFFPNIFNLHTGYWKTKIQNFLFLDQIFSNQLKNIELYLYCPGNQLISKDKKYQSIYQKTQRKNIDFTRDIENLQAQFNKITKVIPYKISSYDIKIKDQIKISSKFQKFDPKIIFLGTKSKNPSDLRNTSGILMELKHSTIQNKEALIMLDCGNSTYDQFLLHYSPEVLDQKIKALKVIFITHLHADHSLGILDLICKRNKLIEQNKKEQQIQNKLFLIIPSNMIGWVHYYCQFVYDLTKECVVLFSQELANEQITIYDKFYEDHQEKSFLYKQKFTRMTQKKKLFKANNKKQQSTTNEQVFSNLQREELSQSCNKKETDALYYENIYNDEQVSVIVEVLRGYMFKQKIIKNQFEKFLKEYGIKKFLPTKVFHCPLSYGIVIEHEQGIKISYSGDCRPTQAFLKEAEKSSLMIHEATLPSFSLEDAKILAHTTFKQAIQAGIQSKSEKICLTHFKSDNFNIECSQKLSQKYFSSKILNHYMKNGIIACDHLQFKLSQMENVSQISRLVGYLGEQFMKNYKSALKQNKKVEENIKQ